MMVFLCEFWDGCTLFLWESEFLHWRGCRGSKFIPMVWSMNSNSIGARIYWDFPQTSISGHLIVVAGWLVALQVFNFGF